MVTEFGRNVILSSAGSSGCLLGLLETIYEDTATIRGAGDYFYTKRNITGDMMLLQHR